jgi:hypothetical protein
MQARLEPGHVTAINYWFMIFVNFQLTRRNVPYVQVAAGSTVKHRQGQAQTGQAGSSATKMQAS